MAPTRSVLSWPLDEGSSAWPRPALPRSPTALGRLPSTKDMDQVGHVWRTKANSLFHKPVVHWDYPLSAPTFRAVSCIPPSLALSTQRVSSLCQVPRAVEAGSQSFPGDHPGHAAPWPSSAWHASPTMANCSPRGSTHLACIQLPPTAL